MQIFFRDLCCKNGKTFNIVVNETTDIDELKQMVEDKIRLPSHNQMYTFNARQLPDVGKVKELLGNEPYEKGWCTLNLYYRH